MAIVHVSPAAGARFTWYSVELEPGGELGPSKYQRFVYVLDGAVSAGAGMLGADAFAYLPPNEKLTFRSSDKARLAVIEKPYQPLDGVAAPKAFFGEEPSIPSSPLGDDPGLQVRLLIPGDMSFDFAVNTMSYAPGATLPMVEIHVMEHGLLMLDGGGTYRLGDDWYAATAGDFIYMAPYCPQWFGALGKSPAKYLIYKDFNRHPLDEPQC
jgi:(S)-ureidoglycine aminohydrolase